MIESLKASEYQKLEDDIDEEMTNVKQVMARRGLGSSNSISQLEARLAKVEHEGKLAIDKNVQDKVLSYQQGIQGIRNEGLNRMLKGAGFEDTASRYNLEVGQQERNLQEGLRASKTNATNTLGLEKFRAEVQGLNNKFVADSAKQRSDAMLGLGAMGMAMNPGGTRNLNDTGGGAGLKNPYEQPGFLPNIYSPAQPDLSFSNAANDEMYNFRSGLQSAPKF